MAPSQRYQVEDFVYFSPVIRCLPFSVEEGFISRVRFNEGKVTYKVKGYPSWYDENSLFINKQEAMEYAVQKSLDTVPLFRIPVDDTSLDLYEEMCDVHNEMIKRFKEKHNYIEK